MTKKRKPYAGGASRLSPAVRRLGYSGSPLPLDEWWKLQEIIRSTPELAGSKRLHLPPVIVFCAQCGKQETRSTAEVSKHYRRGHEEFYCSMDCWGRGTNIKRFGERLCMRCGEAAPKATSSGTHRSGRIFCSKECAEAERAEEYEQRVLERMKPCERCNAMFVPARDAIRFCSRECSSRAHSARMLKGGNPRWKNGVFAQRSAPHIARRFREMRPLILRRDGERCVLCESTKRLHVHHIDEDPLNNRAVNLVTLCPKCHHRVHFSDDKQMLSEKLSKYTEKPMSTTYRWKKTTASSRTESSSTTA